MSSLSGLEASLPPGFRFHPRDDELICDYLMKWVTGCAHQTPLLIKVDLNKCEPWDIAETACVGGKEWYFYSQRDRKYATGIRTNRATTSGYWKATGKDRPIFRKETLVGMRKTLVFYQGRAPRGRKTDWVMHEFRLEGALGPGQKIASSVKEDWVLCKVCYKNSRSELAAAKQDITGGSAGDDTSSSPSSLPELVEPYISFDHTNTHPVNIINPDHHRFHEQVPCFSIFTPPNQTAPTFSLIRTPSLDMLPGTRTFPNNNNGPTTTTTTANNNNPCSDDDTDKNRVIRAVLNHFTKMENATVTDYSNPRSFGEGSSDSYLSEVGGLSSMWSHYS